MTAGSDGYVGIILSMRNSRRPTYQEKKCQYQPCVEASKE